MEKTKSCGRSLRLVFGICLAIITIPVYLKAGLNYNLKSLGIALGLIVFYIILHFLVIKLMPSINRWLGALVAILPVAAVFILGQGNGPIFGQGEGATGVLTFLTISFLIDFIRADSGCEVMAIPGLLFKNRTPLACLALTPIDILEKKLSKQI
ncbi:MAG: hypothetical protein HKN25_06610 [Pyrinomonadaceae bacterium]|nr:hypothetical protein [Pyrinomonadaceae bacterium]